VGRVVDREYELGPVGLTSPVRFWTEPLGDVNSALAIEIVELKPCGLRVPTGETICRFHVTESPGNAIEGPVTDT